MFDDSDEDDGTRYSWYEHFNKDKGKVVFSVRGPGIPKEPNLSGSFNLFDNKSQATTIVSWLNQAYDSGVCDVQKRIQADLGLK